MDNELVGDILEFFETDSGLPEIEDLAVDESGVYMGRGCWVSPKRIIRLVEAAYRMGQLHGED